MTKVQTVYDMDATAWNLNVCVHTCLCDAGKPLLNTPEEGINFRMLTGV